MKRCKGRGARKVPGLCPPRSGGRPPGGRAAHRQIEEWWKARLLANLLEKMVRRLQGSGNRPGRF